MKEILDSIDVYLNGGVLPDGSTPVFDADITGTVATGLSQQVAAPTGNLGYGSDVACFDDISMTEMDDPNSTLSVVAANYRRINTPLGFLDLIDEPADYGFDIQELLQKGMTPTDVTTYQSAIQKQILMDDRNLTCICKITQTTSPDGLIIDLGGTTSLGPYSLTMSLTDAGLLITAMNTEAQQHA
jgi:hypothetical protein